MTAKTSLKPCTCSLVAAVDTDGNVTTTGCTATTKRTFAPGHDARMKGFLIRAGVAEMVISVGEENNRTAEQVADQFGFGYMVAAGIKNGKAKLLGKLLGEVRKGSRKATVAVVKPAPVVVTAKVGRWYYTGTELGGVFSYTDKRGNALTTTKYSK